MACLQLAFAAPKRESDRVRGARSIELDAQGETARLVALGSARGIDTKVSVELVLEAVIQGMRGALLDDGGMPYRLNVD